MTNGYDVVLLHLKLCQTFLKIRVLREVGILVNGLNYLELSTL